MRARIVLRAAEGATNTQIAAEVGVSLPTVGLWRRNFSERGLAGLVTAPRAGRPREIDDADVQRVLAMTLQAPPDGSTHWSARRLAAAAGISASTVHRIWREHKLKPHQVRSFKFSRDPQLVEKVTDVVGLYLAPPKGALVLCVDEKTQIQALDRTQPTLAIKRGKAARMTHDYKRNGTTSLYAALEIATGEITGACYPQHTHQEFLAFLNRLVKAYPRRPLHVVLDNSSTHSTPAVDRWLERHPRVHFHFTPHVAGPRPIPAATCGPTRDCLTEAASDSSACPRPICSGTPVPPLGRELVVEEECHLGVGDAGDRPERVAGAGGEDVGVRRR